MVYMNKEESYPPRVKKEAIALECNLTMRQVNSWLTKRRRGVLKNKNRLSTNQKQLLRNYFINNNKPSKTEMSEMSENLRLTKKKIASWFASERSLNKKMDKKF